jgi:RimJ/RimL family protein N-acetyltransferase
MTFTHRPVHPNDCIDICKWAQNEDELYFFFPKAQFPLTQSQLEESIAQRQDSTVVELFGQCVGFANFYRWEHQGICSIGNVVVSPEARGKGVARYLMNVMVHKAFTKHQASEVTISCFNQNTIGLLLYPSLGFEPFKIEERQDPQGHKIALIHMTLRRP